MKCSNVPWCALALCVLAAEPAAAEIIVCCNSTSFPVKIQNPTNVQFFYDTHDFPVNNTWTNRVISAAQQWTDLLDSSLAFTLSPTSSHSPNNGINEIWFESVGANTTAAKTFRVTNLGGSCGGGDICCPNSGCTPPVILEADVVFYESNALGPISWNTHVAWAFNGDDLFAGTYLLTTAQHELGHAVGLAHAASGLARMSYKPPNGGFFYSGDPGPLARDRGDVHFLYPTSTAFSDPYMANVSQSAADFFSSRSLAYDPGSETDLFYPRTSIMGQSPDVAKVGQSVLVQICTGNLGPNPPLAPMSLTLKLGTDPAGQTNNITVGTLSRPAPAGYAHQCFLATFTVPAMPTGSYYFMYQIGSSGNNKAINASRAISIVP